MLMDQTQTIQPKFSRIIISIMHFNFFSKQTHIRLKQTVLVSDSPHDLHHTQSTFNRRQTNTVQGKQYKQGQTSTNYCKQGILLQTSTNYFRQATDKHTTGKFTINYLQQATDKQSVGNTITNLNTRNTITNQYILFSIGERQTQCRKNSTTKYKLSQGILLQTNTN